MTPSPKPSDGYSQFVTCRPPVKLSRERWEMLYRDVGVSYPLDKIRLAFPAEIDGIVFLPAEYVPADAQNNHPR